MVFARAAWLAALAVLSLPALAECPPDRRIPGEYLVRLRKPDLSTFSVSRAETAVAKLRSRVQESRFIFRGAAKPSIQTFSTNSSEPADLLFMKSASMDLKTLQSDPAVLSVEPNCRVDLFAAPNDTLYPQQWAHQRIQSEAAWEINTGAPQIVIAISDSGVDYTHPDLQPRMWINTAEQNGQAGIDDDQNGCVDDVYGCDFAQGDGDPRPGTAPTAFHGTHVAGIAAAAGNNAVGMAGMAWNSRIMALKGFFDAQDGTTLAALLGTIYYAANNGARVLNCSWGSTSTPSVAEQEAFAFARNRGVVVVVAAGNSYRNASGVSPAAIPSVLTVGASNSLDELSSFSNFGTVVDLIAPGGDTPLLGGRDEGILSTMPVANGSYSNQIGTSMSAPLVAGLAALVLSVNPALTVGQVEQLLIQSADRVTVTVPTNRSLSFTYRRINAANALTAAQASLTSPIVEECTSGIDCETLASELAQRGPAAAGGAVMEGMGGCSRSGSSSNADLGGLTILWLLFSVPLLLARLLRRRS